MTCSTFPTAHDKVPSYMFRQLICAVVCIIYVPTDYMAYFVFYAGFGGRCEWQVGGGRTFIYIRIEKCCKILYRLFKEQSVFSLSWF